MSAFGIADPGRTGETLELYTGNANRELAENIGNYLLRFEKDTCSRCAGSGSYSRGVCWGCDGATTTLTRAGENASKRYDEKLDEIMGVPAEDILPGDKIWARFDSTRDISTFFRPKWRTKACDCVKPRVNPSARRLVSNGSTSTLTETPSSGSSGFSDPLSSKNLAVTVYV